MQIMRDILTVVSRAPSGSNTQPWKGYVIMGKKYDETLQRGLQSPNWTYTTTRTGSAVSKNIAMMIQNVMITAKARDLDTCPQATCNHFHSIVLDVLNAPEDDELIYPPALDYADPDDIVNTFIPPRIAVDEFTVFMDQ